jgi:hypothetical protein
VAGCSKTPDVSYLPDTDTADGCSIRVSEFPGCDDGVRVVYNLVEGGGHTWPGGWQYADTSNVGRTCGDVDYSRAVWDFLNDYTRPADSTSVESAGGEKTPIGIRCSPNPFNAAVKIADSGQRIADSNIGIAIYNTNGKLIQKLSTTSYQLSAGIIWNASGHASGVYVIHVKSRGRTLVQRLLLAK